MHRLKLKAFSLTAATIWLAPCLAMAAPEDTRFSGGSYDGWDMQTSASTSLNGPAVTLSSGQNQTLDGRRYRSTLANLTITDVDGTAIGAGQTLALEFASPLNLKWDIDTLEAYGGTAAAKANPATLSNDDTRLEIFVNADFTIGQTLILSGLRVAGAPFCPQYRPGRILLDIDADAIWDAADPYSITVGMIWSGGSYDGWDRDALQGPTALFRRGTVLSIR